jgi:hypothetical protein
MFPALFPAASLFDSYLYLVFPVGIACSMAVATKMMSPSAETNVGKVIGTVGTGNIFGLPG